MRVPADIDEPLPSDASIVGLRLSWTCALCRGTLHTYQMLRLKTRDGADIDLPRGWKLADGARTICSSHFVLPPAGTEQND